MFNKFKIKRISRIINRYNAFNEHIYLDKAGAEIFAENSLEHFVKNGNNYSISPNNRFDMYYYLYHNPDVKNNGINGLYHYITKGFYEDRKPEENPNYFFWWSKLSKSRKGIFKNIRFIVDCAAIYKSKAFDSMYYCDVYPDVAKVVQSKRAWKYRDSSFMPLRFAAKVLTSPIPHYVKYGAYEGRKPNRNFDTRYYINRYSDVRLSKMNPYVHFIKYGEKEGRASLEVQNNDYNTAQDLFNVNEFINKMPSCDKISKVSVVFAVSKNMPLSKRRLNEILKQKNTEFEIFIAVDATVPEKDRMQLIDLKNTHSRIKEIFEEATMSVALEKTFETLTGEFYVLNCSETIYSNTFLSYGTKAFKNSAITAVKATDECAEKFVYDKKIIHNTESLINRDEEISAYIFKNRKGNFYLNDITSRYGRVNFILDNLLGGAYCEVSATETLVEKINVICPDEIINLQQHKRMVENLYNNFHIPAITARKIYENARTEYLAATKCSVSKFAESYDFAEILKKGQVPVVMVSLVAFTHGGGEIMPIRIANYLKKIGVNVVVHNYGYAEDEPKVREMLDSSINVITTNNMKEMSAYLRILNVDVINTHHVSNQMLVGEVFFADEYIKKRVSHVGTQHGMYEAFDEKAFDYISKFLETNVDMWTYVAEKNIVPFEKKDNFDRAMFVKTPNGVEESFDDSITRESLGIDKDAFILCLASRAIKAKGWKEAIDATTIARKESGKNIVLILIGEGEVYDELNGKTPDYVKLMGFSDKVQSFYAISDMTVLPSYYKSESAPLTIIESLVAGTPVVSSDIGEIRSMIEYENTCAGECFTLENGKVNVEKLARIIVSFTEDENKYKEAKQAAEKYGIRFNMKNVVCEYMKIYNKSLKYTPIDESEIKKVQSSLSLLESSENKWSSTLVSVIVPCYNHEKYLKKRLDSIYNQTYKNFEVILMDDCSRDSSRKIMEEYAQTYKDKTTVLFNEVNSGGVFRQWSKGIKAAKGRICWIAESDDYCDYNFIEKLIPAFDDGKVKISYSNYVFVDVDEEPLKNFTFENYLECVGGEKWKASYVKDSNDEVKEGLGVINTIPNVSAALFVNPNAQPILEDEKWLSMRLCGDWMFYLNIIRDGKVSFETETNNYYRIHNNSTSKTVQLTENYYKEHTIISKLVSELYDIEDDLIKQHENILKFEYEYLSKKPEKSFGEMFNLEELIRYNRKKKEIRAKEFCDNKSAESTMKEKPVVIASGVKLKSTADTFETKIRDVGYNTGNMMFVNALNEQLDVKKIDFYHPELFKDERDVSCVIPSANFIICGEAIEDDGIKFMEGTEFPITLAGLGAQADARNNTPKALVESLNPEKIKFFKMASQRAVSLGIRGSFTAECLEIMGIKNYRIIGCPSFYKHMDGVLPEFKTPSSKKTIMTVTSGNRFESNLVKFGYENNSDWIMQMTAELPYIETGEIQYSQQEIERAFPNLKINKKMLEYMKNHRRLFFNIDEWNEYLEAGEFTFAYGSRFHGNINAFNHGIPTLWITHDSRTKELAEALYLPHITVHQFNSVSNMEQLIEYCNYEETIKHYPELLSNYKQFLKENGLKLNPKYNM
ncbi:MAG: glycosyltransferase [Clostridia bacterium]|nr:glycosyltransferase [Clostridia bacterium]